MEMHNIWMPFATDLAYKRNISGQMQQTVSPNRLYTQKISLRERILKACINAVAESKHPTREATAHQPWNNKLQMSFDTCPAGLCYVKDSHGSCFSCNNNGFTCCVGMVFQRRCRYPFISLKTLTAVSAQSLPVPLGERT